MYTNAHSSQSSLFRWTHDKENIWRGNVNKKIYQQLSFLESGKTIPNSKIIIKIKTQEIISIETLKAKHSWVNNQIEDIWMYTMSPHRQISE